MVLRVPPTSRPHWLIERRVRDYPRLVLGTIVVLAIVYAMTFDNGLDPQGKPAGTDFLNFYSAGRMVLDGRALEAWDYEAVSALQRVIFPGLRGNRTGFPPMPGRRCSALAPRARGHCVRPRSSAHLVVWLSRRPALTRRR